MTQEITSPLANIVAKMAEKQVQGKAAKMRERFQSCTEKVVVLCDVSYSMDSFVASSNSRKYDHMKVAIADAARTYPGLILIAFGSSCREFDSAAALPACGALGGSTDMAKALRSVLAVRPRKTLVISDGLPDNQDKALEAAAELTGSVDTIYCGYDGDPGVRFLQRLSRETAGQQMTWDGLRELGTVVRGLLAAPVGV